MRLNKGGVVLFILVDLFKTNFPMTWPPASIQIGSYKLFKCQVVLQQDPIR